MHMQCFIMFATKVFWFICMCASSQMKRQLHVHGIN